MNKMNDNLKKSDPGSEFTLEYFSGTDIGLVRNENQDRWGVENKDWGFLFIVADGFGDREGGVVASQKVVDGLIRAFGEGSPKDPKFFVQDVLFNVNSDTYILKKSEFDNKMMGSTCVAVLIQDGIAYGTNVGDSRIYLIRNEAIDLVSKDQSLVQEMVDKGIISQEEALSHPGKNILTEAIGSHSKLKIQCCEFPIQLVENDIFLLCTDGLWGLVDEKEIKEICINNSPKDAVEKLIEQAKNNGGHDNVTAQVIQVVGESS